MEKLSRGSKIMLKDWHKRFDEKKIEKGDILLVHTKWNLISYMIRKVTHSHWSHSCLCVSKHHLVEATAKGVVENPIFNYFASRFELKLVRLKGEAFKDREEYEKAISSAVITVYKLEGTKYDFFALVGLYIRYTFRGLAKLLRLDKLNWFQSRFRFYCSELVCICFFESSSLVRNLFAGEKHPSQLCSTITPKDLGKTKNVRYITGINKI